MMRKREWPLVPFTVLAQAAAGACWSLLAARELGAPGLPLFEGLAAVIALLALGVGIAASHLGHPARGALAAANARTSWLSREMIAGLAFGLSVVALIAAERLGAGQELWSGLAVAAAFLGALLVLAIARLYMLRTVPAWDSPATPLAFFLTALAGGGAVIHALASLAGGDPAWLGVTAGAAAVSGVLVFATHLALLRRGGAAARAAAAAVGAARGLVAGRVVTSLLGAALLAVPLGPEVGPILAVPAALLLIVGELLGRALFFIAFHREGLNL